MNNKRGRPHKWDPQIIAGWRQARGATIAATAKHFMVSTDTVKRASRDYGDGALLARQAWFHKQCDLLTDRLLEVHEKRGGYLPVVRNLSRRIKMLEIRLRETEHAMVSRGLAYTPSPYGKQHEESAEMAKLREWDRVLGFEDLEEDGFGGDGGWELNHHQQQALGW